PAEGDAGPVEARVNARAGWDQELNVFVPRECPDDLGVYPRDRPEPAGPVGLVVRPGEPGRGVRLPLGWHAVAAGGGGVCGFGHRRSLTLPEEEDIDPQITQKTQILERQMNTNPRKLEFCPCVFS